MLPANSSNKLTSQPEFVTAANKEFSGQATYAQLQAATPSHPVTRVAKWALKDAEGNPAILHRHLLCAFVYFSFYLLPISA
jgi:hypothetical protein